jgi:twitching motility protein PilT
MVSLRELLEVMVKRNASDLHITVGTPPMLRVDGKLVKIDQDILRRKIPRSCLQRYE